MISPRDRFINLSNKHFSQECYDFLYTSKKWEAKHTSLLNCASANKEFSQAMQKLRRDVGKDFKYTASREFSFNKQTRKWRYGFHVKVNKKINLKKINKEKYTGDLRETQPSYFSYEAKAFNFTARLGIRSFTTSHNVK